MRRILALILALACLSLPALAADRVVATASVNLRSGPGLDYAIVTAFTAGDALEYLNEVAVDERGVAWYHARSERGEGWISSKYSKLEDIAPPDAVRVGSAADLLGYYRKDLEASASALGLTDYARVASEVPNRYSDGALTLAGYDTVDCIIIEGPGFTLAGAEVGMAQDAAQAAMLDAGLVLYESSGEGFSVEYPGTNPALLAIGDFGGIIYVEARDGAVTSIDLESYTG